jgi:predicted  nucleic acid-binding Zn-ribbon protein
MKERPFYALSHLPPTRAQLEVDDAHIDAERRAAAAAAEAQQLHDQISGLRSQLQQLSAEKADVERKAAAGEATNAALSAALSQARASVVGGVV